MSTKLELRAADISFLGFHCREIFRIDQAVHIQFASESEVKNTWDVVGSLTIFRLNPAHIHFFVVIEKELLAKISCSTIFDETEVLFGKIDTSASAKYTIEVVADGGGYLFDSRSDRNR
jgi:hypothetical protein